MTTLVIKSNAGTTSDVLIADMGILIPSGGGSETFTDDTNINDAGASKDLLALTTDDAFGAGSSTLILNDGVSDIPQGDVDAFLQTVIVIEGSEITGHMGLTRQVQFDLSQTNTFVSIDGAVFGFKWKNTTSNPVLGTVILTDLVKLDANPVLSLELYTSFSGGGPGAGDVKVDVTLRYLAAGEAADKAADETLTTTLSMSAANKTKTAGSITLDKTKISASDLLSVILERDFGDVADTYGDNVVLAGTAMIKFG